MSKKILGLTLEEVNNTALWVVRFTSGHREVGIYSEVVKYWDDENCKDLDLVCCNGQPEALKPFFKKVEQLIECNGWMTLPELFDRFGAEDEGPKYRLGKDKMLKYIKAGKATITLQSGDTGAYYTYRVRKHKKEPVWFVSLFAGKNNDEDYFYMAYFREDNVLRTSKKGIMKSDATPVQAFDYFLKHINNIPEKLAVFHSGTCCRCGRTLTTPESIEAGIGPECAKLV